MSLRMIALSVLLAGVASPVSAQNLSLSPSVIELKGRAGQTTTQTLTLTNTSSIELAFALEAQDVVVENGVRRLVRAGETAGGIAETAVFAPKTLIVPAGQVRSARVTVTMPSGASSRAIVALFRGTTRIPNGTTGATASLGALMTFALSDGFSMSPIGALVVIPQSASRNITFEQALKNDGTEPIVPRGIAVILNSAGAIVGKAPFEGSRALPGERVTLRSEYSGELTTGSYTVLATFEFAGKSLTRTAALVVR